MIRLVIALIGMLFLLVFSVWWASSNRPRDVAIIWYGFSLSLLGTLLIGFWAEHTGAIDSAGVAQGDGGRLIIHALNFSWI